MSDKGWEGRTCRGDREWCTHSWATVRTHQQFWHGKADWGTVPWAHNVHPAHPGAEDVYWDIPRCFSSQGPAGTWHSALRNSKLWAEHCPCLNSSNQDFIISLREKFFDKPTQDSFSSCSPWSSPFNWIVLYFSLYSISLLPSLPTHPSFPFFFY